MRSRSSMLLLVAILLAVIPLYMGNAAAARCAQFSGEQDSGAIANFFTSGTDTPDSCMAVNALPLWARGFGFLAAVCFAGWLVLSAKALYERRQEREIMRAVRQAESRRGDSGIRP